LAGFVGEQCPFVKGKMKHCFALVREQRHARLMLRINSRLHFLLIVAAQNNSFSASALLFDPTRNLLRYPQLKYFDLQVPSPLIRKSVQVQENMRPATERNSTR
jgi:hypothetical protein